MSKYMEIQERVRLLDFSFYYKPLFFRQNDDTQGYVYNIEVFEGKGNPSR